MVHETDSHEANERAGDDEGFLVFCVFDEEGDDERGNGGGEGEYLNYVAGGGDGEILDDERVGVEVWLD